MRKVRPALVELTLARTKEFLRETEAIFWVFGFPLLFSLVLGFAFRDKGPDKVLVGIIDGPQAVARLAALKHSPVLQARIYSADDARLALRRGKVSLLIESGPAIVYRFDATRPDSRVARVEVDDALQQAAGRHDAFAPKEEHVREVGSRYIDFLIPGLLGMNIMGTSMWGVGFTIVNARMKKLLKRLAATPMKKSQYLIAQLLSRLVFLVLEVTTLLLFARFVFDVRVNGSYFFLAALCLLGGVAFSGLGLLIASRVRTIDAANGLMNLVMMPMWLCSGIFFSYERFPDAMKPVIRALPLTALNDALRGLINDGLPIAQVMPQIAVLAAWAVVTFLVGLKIFRWQ